MYKMRESAGTNLKYFTSKTNTHSSFAYSIKLKGNVTCIYLL